MKLSFDRVALTDAFGLVAGVAPSRTTKEILKNVKEYVVMPLARAVS